MGKRIAIISSASQGAPRLVEERLAKGLRRDGHSAEVITYNGRNVFSRTAQDLERIRYLSNFNQIIYGNSTPQTSGIFLQNTSKALFLHGAIIGGLVATLKFGGIGDRIRKVSVFGINNVIRHMDRFDWFIARSQTAAEMNGLKGKVVILPQFILGNEACKIPLNQSAKTDNIVRIAIYTSGVIDPRLLTPEDLLLFSKTVLAKSKKEVVIYIVDPLRRVRSPSKNIVVLGRLTRDKFLGLLRSCDLYIERCTDEEIGESAIESGLRGIPVAKVCLPKYHARRDYGDGDVIVSNTVIGLAEKVSNFINNISNLKPEYQSNFLKFLLEKRSWDYVKRPIENAI